MPNNAMKKAISAGGRLIGKFRKLKYMYYKAASLPKRLTGNLILAEQVRLVVPLRCDGKGKVEVNRNTTLGYRGAIRMGNGCVMLQAREENSSIKIGTNCAFSNNVSIIAVQSVEIGDDCLIGDLVTIMDSDFHGVAPDKRRSGPIKSAPVKLENNVWLGSRALILRGVTIGSNSIVAPGAVVTSSIPANCVAGGVPATVIKSIA